MSNLNKEEYKIIESALFDLVEQTEFRELSDDHPLLKIMSAMAGALCNADYAGLIKPNTYYCRPHAFYTDDPRESYVPCPVCGNPPDYCTDHNHYYCEKCGNPLDFQNENAEGEDMWACEHCEHCKHCGSPNIFTSSLHEKQYKRCEDCGQFEPLYYEQEEPE